MRSPRSFVAEQDPFAAHAMTPMQTSLIVEIRRRFPGDTPPYAPRRDRFAEHAPCNTARAHGHRRMRRYQRARAHKTPNALLNALLQRAHNGAWAAVGGAGCKTAWSRWMASLQECAGWAWLPGDQEALVGVGPCGEEGRVQVGGESGGRGGAGAKELLGRRQKARRPSVSSKGTVVSIF